MGEISLPPTLQFDRRASDGFHAGFERDKGVDALAFDVMRKPTTAASATWVFATRRISTSAVPNRWPETLITSSTRPVIHQ